MISSRFKKEYFIGLAICVLCFLSGAINVHFVRLFSFAVGYLAGDTIRLFIETSQARHELAQALVLLAIVVCFIFGAITAGYVVHHPRLDISRAYGRSLMSIGFFFICAAFLEKSKPHIAIPMAAFASGLQNALATKYKGVILRTTHITGIVTDFGQSTGMRLAGNNIDSWKIWLYLFLFLSFLFGIASGLIIDNLTGDRSAYIFGGVYVILGILFFVFKRWGVYIHKSDKVKINTD